MLENVINSAAKYREAIRSAEISANLGVTENLDQTKYMTLFHAALLLRSYKKESNEIDINPLDPADICQEREEKIVSNYTLLWHA